VNSFQVHSLEEHFHYFSKMIMTAAVLKTLHKKQRLVSIRAPKYQRTRRVERESLSNSCKIYEATSFLNGAVPKQIKSSRACKSRRHGRRAYFTRPQNANCPVMEEFLPLLFVSHINYPRDYFDCLDGLFCRVERNITFCLNWGSGLIFYCFHRLFQSFSI